MVITPDGTFSYCTEKPQLCCRQSLKNTLQHPATCWMYVRLQNTAVRHSTFHAGRLEQQTGVYRPGAVSETKTKPLYVYCAAGGAVARWTRFCGAGRRAVGRRRWAWRHRFKRLRFHCYCDGRSVNRNHEISCAKNGRYYSNYNKASPQCRSNNGRCGYTHTDIMKQLQVTTTYIYTLQTRQSMAITNYYQQRNTYQNNTMRTAGFVR